VAFLLRCHRRKRKKIVMMMAREAMGTVTPIAILAGWDKECVGGGAVGDGLGVEVNVGDKLGLLLGTGGLGRGRSDGWYLTKIFSAMMMKELVSNEVVQAVQVLVVGEAVVWTEDPMQDVTLRASVSREQPLCLLKSMLYPLFSTC
jgi:hypothetical protein